MKFFCRIFSGVLLCLLFSAAAWAAPHEETPLEQAQLELFCAWTDMASYDDRLGDLARAQLVENGWQVQSFHEYTPTADAKFHLISRVLPNTGEKVYILAIAGTESKKDIQIDLKLGKVFFGGTTKESFAESAQKKDLTADMPMVHQGFDQYTQVAFFTRAHEDGRTLGEYIRDSLLANPDAKLYITGHSLGGAVATLLSARLAAMGVPQQQLEVVTYGAPAVGNEAFARQYGDAMQLSRIVMKDDPVHAVLQSLPNGYAQFGTKQEWRRNRNTENFQHNMLVYADAALRNFYDMKREQKASPESLPIFRGAPVMTAPVYVAPFHFEMHEALKEDEFYMQSLLQNTLADRIQGVVFDTSGQKSLDILCKFAKAAGCQYVLVEHLFGERVRDSQSYIFNMGLQEEMYDLDGNLLFVQGNTTNTEDMTPIEALLYDQVATQQGREEALRKHMENKEAGRL